MLFDTVTAARVLTLPKFAHQSGAALNAHLLERVKQDRAVPGDRDPVADWTTFYHVDHSRAAVLAPLWDRLTSPVLELGCGTGALTEHLGRRGLDVTAVDSSAARRTITGARCAHLPGVTVTDPETVTSRAGKFATVLLIGVLEYSPQQHRHLVPLDACRAVLRQARDALADGGRLVLAIENQVGAKYFAGAGEDHNDVAYYGLEGRYGGRDAVTFGRRQLRGLLDEAGFDHQNWYYPFPDYKFPACTLSHSATDPEGPFDPRPLLRWANRFRTHTEASTFDVGRALAAVWENGFLDALANSFVVECSAAPLPPEPGLAWVHTPPGCAEKHTSTWVVTGDLPGRSRRPGRWRLRRQEGHGDTAPPEALLSTETHLSRAQDLLAASRGPLSADGVAGMLGPWFIEWVEALTYETDLLRPTGVGAGRRHDRRLLGATPGNLFHSDGSCRFGSLPDPPPLDGDPVVDTGWVVYRGLLHTALQLRGRHTTTGSTLTVGDFIHAVGTAVLPPERTRALNDIRSRETCLLVELGTRTGPVDLAHVEALPF